MSRSSISSRQSSQLSSRQKGTSASSKRYEFKPTINYDFRLNKHELLRYKRVFDAFDDNLQGIVLVSNLHEMLASAGLNITNSHVKDIMEEFDWNRDSSESASASASTDTLDLMDFFIIIARNKREVSSTFGGNGNDNDRNASAEELEKELIKKAFCGLYTDISGLPSVVPFLLPADILHKHVCAGGEEPLTEQQYEKFIILVRENCPECVLEDGLAFDAELLYNFISNASILNSNHNKGSGINEEDQQVDAKALRRSLRKSMKLELGEGGIEGIDGFSDDSDSDSDSDSDELSSDSEDSQGNPKNKGGTNFWVNPDDLLKKGFGTGLSGLTTGFELLKSGVNKGISTTLSAAHQANEMRQKVQESVTTFIPSELLDLGDAIKEQSSTFIRAADVTGMISKYTHNDKDNDKEIDFDKEFFVAPVASPTTLVLDNNSDSDDYSIYEEKGLSSFRGYSPVTATTDDASSSGSQSQSQSQLLLKQNDSSNSDDIGSGKYKDKDKNKKPLSSNKNICLSADKLLIVNDKNQKTFAENLQESILKGKRFTMNAVSVSNENDYKNGEDHKRRGSGNAIVKRNSKNKGRKGRVFTDAAETLLLRAENDDIDSLISD